MISCGEWRLSLASSCGEGKLSLGSYMRLSNHMGKRNLTKVVSSCGEGKLSLGSYEVMLLR